MAEEDESVTAIVEQVASSKVTAKLFAAMPAIERKLSQGVGHKEIVDALREGGFDITLDTFRNVLYRYRRIHGRVKKRKSVDAEKPKAPAKAQDEKPKLKPKSEGGKEPSPSIVDKILSERNDY